MVNILLFKYKITKKDWNLEFWTIQENYIFESVSFNRIAVDCRTYVEK